MSSVSRQQGGSKPGRSEDGTVFCLKILLMIFNFTLLLSGAALIGVGIWTLVVKHSYVRLLSNGTYETITYLFVFTGCFIVLVIFIIGCCGAWNGHRICLLIYAVLLVLIFLLELITGILSYLYQRNLVYELTDNLNKTMLTSYQYDPQKTEAINDLHRTFKCCGAGSFSDWLSVSTSVPDSCCKTQSTGCALTSSHPSNIYYRGCVNSLEEFLREHIVILGAIGLGLCCLQIFGIVVSCCLAKRIKDWKTSRYNSSWQ